MMAPFVATTGSWLMPSRTIRSIADCTVSSGARTATSSIMISPTVCGLSGASERSNAATILRNVEALGSTFSRSTLAMTD